MIPSIVRYSTPAVKLTFYEVQDLDLTAMDEIDVTFDSNGASFTKTGNDLEVGEKYIEVILSQEETAQLAEGYFKIQVNCYKDGRRIPSTVEHCNATEQLLEEVIPIADDSNEGGNLTS